MVFCGNVNKKLTMWKVKYVAHSADKRSTKETERCRVFTEIEFIWSFKEFFELSVIGRSSDYWGVC